MSLTLGCNRQYYREQADQEAAELIEEKSDDPRWSLDEFSILVDERSRYADIYDPDRPPMPEDDPASHQFMNYIDGKQHYDGWLNDGVAAQLENPDWRESLNQFTTLRDDGSVELSLPVAIALARTNSPSYQENLETLYLSALDVSTERFRFDVQFFGGNGTAYTQTGEERGGPSNLIRNDTDALARRRFATAGELLVNFANNLTWEFFGADNNTASSIINFSFVQPLLRRGGRAFALEQLTITERGLLANLRAFQRYRQGFYTNVAIGDLGVSGPQRRGGFFGGTGLTGFTGQGSGGFGGVGDATGFGRSFFGGGTGGAGGSGAGFAGGGAGTVGGYIGLLQQLQQIRNTEESLNAQLRTLRLLEANLDAGLIDIAQVDQFRQNIETEKANLLQARNNLESALDTFKRSTLGFPPNLPIELNDELIQQFQFISPANAAVQKAIGAYIDDFGQLPEQPTDEQFAEAFKKIEELRKLVEGQFDVVPQELKQLDEQISKRSESLSDLEKKRLASERKRMGEALSDVKKQFDLTAEQLKKLKDGLNDQNREATGDGIVELLSDLANLVAELSLIQARARLELIELSPIDLSEDLALEIARAHRLDWMNNRAALVDTWRLIQFNANALQSDVSIRFAGDLQTLGNDNPAKFRDENGSLTASLQIDPPFTRLIERNNFRQQLIEYQQDRRQLIQFEDLVLQNVRQLLRTLEQLRINLEIQRRAVAIAIRRVDQTREALNQPVPPAQPGQLPQSFGPTAAQNLLFALSDLRNTQNNLMSVWLNHLATRMRLYRELAIMQVDEANLWNDIPLENAIIEAFGETEPLPPEVPDDVINQLEEEPPAAPGVEPPAPVPAADNAKPVPANEEKLSAARRGRISLASWIRGNLPPNDESNDSASEDSSIETVAAEHSDEGSEPSRAVSQRNRRIIPIKKKQRDLRPATKEDIMRLMQAIEQIEAEREKDRQRAEKPGFSEKPGF
ncbi:MAG: hypothetical protein CMJ78_18020 [Planctomycetaceae bacterium]|nr:hypothetical protein [Planctomycetaceae bacterium]